MRASCPHSLDSRTDSLIFGKALSQRLNFKNKFGEHLCNREICFLFLNKQQDLAMGSSETLPEKEACSGGGDGRGGKMPAASRSRGVSLLESGCRAAGRGREGSWLRQDALAAPAPCNTAAASISPSYCK